MEQEIREQKLSKLREIRNKALKDIDAMINEVVLGLRNDKEAIIAKRQALLDVTNQYKNVDGTAKIEIDNIHPRIEIASIMGE